MRQLLSITFAIVAVSVPAAAGMIPHSPDSAQVNVAQQLADADVVCKGEVIETPAVKLVTGEVPRGTGLAIVRVDRCFKGEAVPQLAIVVDEFLPSGGWGGAARLLIPTRGEYGLFFVTRSGAVYKPIERGEAFLRDSRFMPVASASSDPVKNLEADFLAAMTDSDEGVRLSAMWDIGTLGRLTPKAVAALKHAADTGGGLIRLYAWASLLSGQEYTVLPEAAAVLSRQNRSRNFSMPADRIDYMRYRVQEIICGIHDPIIIPYMRKLARSAEPRDREDAIQALRQLRSVETADVFLDGLHDTEGDIAYISMQSLFELAGQGPGWEHIPGPEEFRSGDSVAGEVTAWWLTTGKSLAQRAAASVDLNSATGFRKKD